MTDQNMNPVENNAAKEIASATDSPDFSAMGTDFGNNATFGEADELAAMFAEDIKSLEVEASISEDLSGFAAGFPDWDLHPIKTK